jgi:phosphonoacetaldehyde hydrolase
MTLNQIKAAVFDWAGTIVDHGSLAPMGAFVEAFGVFGVAVTVEEARVPMGMAERPHVAALLAMPRIAAEWLRVRGTAPTQADIDAVYNVFVPKNLGVAADLPILLQAQPISRPACVRTACSSAVPPATPTRSWRG